MAGTAMPLGTGGMTEAASGGRWAAQPRRLLGAAWSGRMWKAPAPPHRAKAFRASERAFAVFGRWKPLFALKPLHVDAVFADFRPKGARIEAEEFGGAVPPGDFAVGAVERLNDVADGDLVECLEWFRMALFAVRLLPALWGRGVKCAIAGMFGKDIQEIIGKDGLEAGTNVEMFLRVVVHAY